MIFENIYEYYLHQDIENGIKMRWQPPIENKLQCNKECINMYIFGFMMGEYTYE
jgi:hypothetical protein